MERPGWGPAGQDVPAPARRVGRVAGASPQHPSPSSRTSLAPGERPAPPAVGPRPGSAPRRGGSGAGQRRTRHRQEPTAKGEGAGIVSQERPLLRPLLCTGWDGINALTGMHRHREEGSALTPEKRPGPYFPAPQQCPPAPRDPRQEAAHHALPARRSTLEAEVPRRLAPQDAPPDLSASSVPARPRGV